ncbi:MAG TPA: ATP-binding cassette domain-containing protein [Negativicutes bacterium]|jgi:branched-chain amino acid transport system ATP-binding protein
MDAELKVQDICISFGDNHVLKSLSFDVRKNEILGVIGPNGAGKTVMLNILTGIVQPTKGDIFFQGENITAKTITERCKMGFGRTFQVPRPFEKMTVFENVIVGGVYGGQISEKNAKKRALEFIELTGLSDKIEWFAGKLGLLDRKKLEIARALAGQPKILLFDEVAGGLTESEVGNILTIVKKIKEKSISIVWIEHVLKIMREGTDRILLLAGGRNMICSSSEEVMQCKQVHEVYLGADEE